MTWFEAEQIYSYVVRLEEMLDAWTLNRSEMQTEQAELLRLKQRLDKEIDDEEPSPRKKEILTGLFTRLQQCQVCIGERLKY